MLGWRQFDLSEVVVVKLEVPFALIGSLLICISCCERKACIINSLARRSTLLHSTPPRRRSPKRPPNHQYRTTVTTLRESLQYMCKNSGRFAIRKCAVLYTLEAAPGQGNQLRSDLAVLCAYTLCWWKNSKYVYSCVQYCLHVLLTALTIIYNVLMFNKHVIKFSCSN